MTDEEVDRRRTARERIRKAMLRLGLTHSYVAEKVGRGRANISMFLAGKTMSLPMERAINKLLRDERAGN
jgi:transcriptional regulator with XRE-family HTH domain